MRWPFIFPEESFRHRIRVMTVTTLTWSGHSKLTGPESLRGGRAYRQTRLSVFSELIFDNIFAPENMVKSKVWMSESLSLKPLFWMTYLKEAIWHMSLTNFILKMFSAVIPRLSSKIDNINFQTSKNRFKIEKWNIVLFSIFIWP